MHYSSTNARQTLFSSIIIWDPLAWRNKIHQFISTPHSGPEMIPLLPLCFDKWVYIYLNNNSANNYDWNAKQRANRIVSLHQAWYSTSHPRLTIARGRTFRSLFRRICERDLSEATITSSSNDCWSISKAASSPMSSDAGWIGWRGDWDMTAQEKVVKVGVFLWLSWISWLGSRDRPIQKRSAPWRKGRRLRRSCG